jgi:predicted metal-dependent phosphoesterase TrpH
MRRRPEPLLCELHAHSRWSDGLLPLTQLVDLYGRSGFDVLCVTDHTNRDDDPWRGADGWVERSVGPETWASYLAEVERETARARAQYGMLVVPGLELTFNDAEPDEAAHAVAVGLRSFVSVDHGIAGAIETAVQAGAAVIAAHPYKGETASHRTRLTQRFAHDEALRTLVHRFELFNRTQLFGWVAEAGLPAVATGDFHRPEHLVGWKTLVPSIREETAVVDYLRSRRPVYLARLEADTPRLAA